MNPVAKTTRGWRIKRKKNQQDQNISRESQKQYWLSFLCCFLPACVPSFLSSFFIASSLSWFYYFLFVCLFLLCSFVPFVLSLVVDFLIFNSSFLHLLFLRFFISRFLSSFLGVGLYLFLSPISFGWSPYLLIFSDIFWCPSKKNWKKCGNSMFLLTHVSLKACLYVDPFNAKKPLPRSQTFMELADIVTLFLGKHQIFEFMSNRMKELKHKCMTCQDRCTF